jgi:AraC-like DNA-binding protein
MNMWTLQRRLAEPGVSYRRPLDDGRRRQAEETIGRHNLPVSEVSRRPGYSDRAHIVRAFRRWTGRAPSHFEAKVEKGQH